MSRPTKAMLEKENAALRLQIASLQNQSARHAQAKTVLHESGEHFRLLFETLPLGVVYQDANGSVIQANPAAERILGLSLDQLQGRTSTDPRWQAIHEDGSDFPGETHPAMQSLQTGQIIRDIVMGVYNPAEDTLRWINVTAFPHFKSGEAKPFEVLATFEDITERKLSQDALRQSEEKFAIAFNASPAALLIITPVNGRIVDVNDTFLQMLEYNREQVIGYTTFELSIYPKLHEPDEFGRISQEQGCVQNREVTLKTRTGKTLHALFSTELFKLNGEEHSITIAIDITDRKRAEEALLQSEARYRLISENSADVIWVLNPAMGKFTYVSPSVKKLRGYTPEEVMAQPVSESLTPASLKLVNETMAATLPAFMANGNQYVSSIYEIDQPHKDGTIVNTEVTTTYIINERNEVEIVGVTRDITERKLAEFAIKESLDKLELLFDILPVGVSVLDQNRKVVKSNQALEEILIIPETKLLSGVYPKRRYFRSDGTLKPMAEFPSIRIFNGEKKVTHDETGIEVEDGTIVWTDVSAVASPIADWNAVIVSLDITARKLAEKELQNSYLFNQEIISGAGEGIYAVDSQLNIVLWNPFMETLTGLSAKEVLGNNILELLPFMQNQEIDRFYEKVLTGETVTSGDLPFRIAHTDKSGWRSSTYAPHRDSSGDIIGVIGQVSDTTARKQAEEDIREQAARAEALLRTAARLNFQLDLDILLQTVCEEAAAALHAPAVWINLYDPAKELFVLASHTGMQPDFAENYKPVPKSQYDIFVGKMSPIVIFPDQQTALGLHNAGMYKKLNIESLALASLIHEKQVIGAISVASFDKIRLFNEGELNLLKGLADQAALAIVNTRLFEQVVASRKQLGELSKALINVQESERRNLARELHDEIGQTLTALKILLQIARRSPLDESREKLQQAQHLAGDLIDRISSLSLDLRPPMLDDLGLLPALLWFINRCTVRTNIQIDFVHIGLKNIRFSPVIETAVYRIVQESLTNVARHAEVNQATVYISAEKILKLVIADTGAGFDLKMTESRTDTGGLNGMRERIRLLGGNFEVNAKPGFGTQIVVNIPLNSEEPHNGN